MARVEAKTVILLLLVAGLAACRTPSLPPSAAAKLDADLRQLVEGRPRPDDRYVVARRSDGARVYGVLLLVDAATGVEALRGAGVPFESAPGDVVSARLTVEEIARAAALDAVRSIRNALRTYPQ